MKPLEQLSVTTYPSPYTSNIDQHQWTAVFFTEHDVWNKRKLKWLQANSTDLNATRVYSGDHRLLWMRACWELSNNFGRVLLAGRKTQVVNGGYKLQHGLADCQRPLKVEASKYSFLHTPSTFPTDTLERIPQDVLGTLEKRFASGTAKEKRIWNQS